MITVRYLSKDLQSQRFSLPMAPVWCSVFLARAAVEPQLECNDDKKYNKIRMKATAKTKTQVRRQLLQQPGPAQPLCSGDAQTRR